MIIESLTRRLLNAPGPLDPYWYSSVGRRTRAGVPVDEAIAETYSACWAATRLLSGTSAYLPFNLCQRLPNGDQRVCEGETLHSLLHDAPNPEMSSTMWRSMKFAQQINYGNCFSEIERDIQGGVKHLWPIHTTRVTMREDPETGELYYEVRNNDGTVTPIPYVDMFHVPSMMSDDGRWGKGIIRYAAETIGLALATDRYGAGWFGSGGRPVAVLKHPKTMDDAARANVRREWREIYGPESPDKVAVLWEGMEYMPITTNPEESQFLQSRQWNLEDVARWYGVPPHMIGHLLRSTNNNIEQQGIEFVKYSLLMWIKVWEQEVWRKLLTEPQRQTGYYAKFTVDALERGDATTRTAALVQQFFNGALTLNQWAKIEDRPPIGPLGDLHFVQSAMVPLEIAAKGPQPAPAATPPAIQAPEPPAKPPRPPEAPGARQEEKLAAGIRATKDVFGEISGVMLEMESQKALKASRKPSDFLNWLDSFYDEHAARLKKVLSRSFRAYWLVSGRDIDPAGPLEAAVDAYVASRKADLLAASEVTVDRFEASVAACVGSWTPHQLTDLALGDQK